MKLVIPIFLSVLASLIVVSLIDRDNTQTPLSKETVFQSFADERVLRCGFSVWDPGIYVDDQNNMQGLVPELMRLLAKIGGFEVQWSQEIGWGEIQNALDAKKIDAHCAGMWRDPRRAHVMTYTKGLFVSDVAIVVRHDDLRFPDKLYQISDLNDPNLKLPIIEGGILDPLTKDRFPKAQLLPLPMLSSDAENILSVVTKKADFAMVEKTAAIKYIQSNPDKIKILSFSEPVARYRNVIALNIRENTLRESLNVLIEDMKKTSDYKKIMAKYNALYPGSLLLD